MPPLLSPLLFESKRKVEGRARQGGTYAIESTIPLPSFLPSLLFFTFSCVDLVKESEEEREDKWREYGDMNGPSFIQTTTTTRRRRKGLDISN